MSILNVLVTQELVETGAECIASNSLGSNTTTIILKLGENCLPAEVGRGVSRQLTCASTNPPPSAS